MDWSKYISKPDVVLNGKTTDGNRLVLLFAEDFSEKMGRSLDIGCPKCFREDFKKFINTKNKVMSKNTDVFEVKKKYDGLAHKCSNNILSNVAIQDSPEVAVEFYVEHPIGKDLFQKVPKGIKKLVDSYNKSKEEGNADKKNPTENSEKKEEGKDDVKKS